MKEASNQETVARPFAGERRTGQIFCCWLSLQNSHARRITEAAGCLLAGDVETAKTILRDYINATVGFEKLGAAVHKSPKSLMRMFGEKGNPQAQNLFSIFAYIQKKEKIKTRGTSRTGLTLAARRLFLDKPDKGAGRKLGSFFVHLPETRSSPTDIRFGALARGVDERLDRSLGDHRVSSQHPRKVLKHGFGDLRFDAQRVPCRIDLKPAPGNITLFLATTL
jgi:hypothetical protein